MFINTKFSRCQQQRIQKYAKNSDSYKFFNLLTRPELLSTVEELLPEHRERLYPPTETLSMFLAQALNEDRSCQKAVNDAVVQRIMAGLPTVSTATGGYCRARQRLPLAMISELVCQTGELINSQIPEQWCWQSSQKPGLGFPICRLVGVTCLSSGIVLNAAIGQFKGKGSGEQSLLRNIIDTFKSGDLVLGDAFYGTSFLLASLRERSVDAVFEQMGARKRITDFRKGKTVGSKDHLIAKEKA